MEQQANEFLSPEQQKRFNHLWNKHGKRVYLHLYSKLATNRVRKGEDWEDAEYNTQEVFLKVMRAIKKGEKGTAPKEEGAELSEKRDWAWIRTITNNYCIDLFRSQEQ